MQLKWSNLKVHKRLLLCFWGLIFKCLWFIFCSKNFNTQCLGFERQRVWLQKRVDSFSIWFWFDFWLFLFVFSSWFYYNALARLFSHSSSNCFERSELWRILFSVSFIELFKEGEEVGGGWEGTENRVAEPVNCQPERNVTDKIRAGLPDELLYPGSFAHFLYSTTHTHWAFVLKMPQWNASHRQIAI